MNEKRRVVITGMGTVSCLGVGVKALWDGVLDGRSGIGPITQFDASDFRCRVAGEANDFDVEKYMSLKEARRLDRFCHLGVAASDEAVKQAGLDNGGFDPMRVGVLVGSGVGGIHTFRTQTTVLENRGPRRSSPLTVPMMIVDMASGAISIRHGFKGPNLAVVTACATASHAIGEAMWMIKRGDADIMLAGGAEACIDPMGLAGFCAMKALTSRNDDPTGASRPFDAGRDGFVPAEGAGILVLESLESAQKRQANILAEVVGYGLTGDAYHITAPDPEAEGAARAFTNAMNQAELTPADIGYINAHGTSTPLNDKSETLAIKKALGARAYEVPVSSTKSMTGHGLGAAGGLESAVCVMALREGVVPPTINYETPDPNCDLDYVPLKAREVAAKTAVNINLGFGGHNAVLLFKKWE
jgi:3-oxoacyl-[acyl-carrier-protein] synthase II